LFVASTDQACHCALDIDASAASFGVSGAPVPRIGVKAEEEGQAVHLHWPVRLPRTVSPFDYVAPLPVTVGSFDEAQRAVYRGVAFNGWAGVGLG
jgi:hypothetical protein